jgi:pimeloyl-ACP methyl ester carboxylesterase
MRLRDVRVGALRVAYVTAGEGVPLVLLHGGWGDHRHLRRQLEGLDGDFALAAWDAPGCGHSDDPPETWGMGDYADCLAAWLEAAKISRPNLLGFSWGGALALELYRRHRHVPASLILAGGYAGWAGSLPPEEVAKRVARVEAELDRPPSEWAAGYLPGLLTDRAPPELVDELLGIMGDIHPGGTRTMLHAMAAADLRDVLPLIEVPTLLLWGELDARSPLRVAEELHAATPGSELEMLPDAGHFASGERPDEFNAAVRRFLLR